MEIEDTDQPDPDANGVHNTTRRGAARSRRSMPGQDFELRFGKVKQASTFRHEGDDVSKQCSENVRSLALDVYI